MIASQKRALGVLLVMVVAATAALWLRPNSRLADQQVKLELESLIPRQFGEWVMAERQNAAIVIPQAGDLQSQLYQQVVSRTYIHRVSQHAIMLSVAYGENQNRSNDLHVPDVCYPAGGFRIEYSERDLLATSFGMIPVKRLMTQRLQRREPLTYWAIIGEHVATSAVGSKLLALSYGLRGTVPDGIVFRVSSVGIPDNAAFSTQQEFVQSLLDALPPDGRKRLTGI